MAVVPMAADSCKDELWHHRLTVTHKHCPLLHDYARPPVRARKAKAGSPHPATRPSNIISIKMASQAPSGALAREKESADGRNERTRNSKTGPVAVADHVTHEGESILCVADSDRTNAMVTTKKPKVIVSVYSKFQNGFFLSDRTTFSEDPILCLNLTTHKLLKAEFLHRNRCKSTATCHQRIPP